MGISFFLLAYVLAVRLTLLGAAGETCTGPQGQQVREGMGWVALDGCTLCTCTQFGVDCTKWWTCPQNSVSAKPGDLICVYGYTRYPIGRTWTAEDTCNKCVCTARGMNCTAHPCANTGFASPKSQGESAIVEFMDCRYKDRVYRYGDHFLADDGCNTCICVMPGNYATFPVCTVTPCDVFVVG